MKVKRSSLTANSLDSLLNSRRGIVIQQVKEWTEILIDWETRNKYEVLTPTGDPLGIIVENQGSLMTSLRRFILRSHRPLDVVLYGLQKKILLRLHRNFFFFFSDLFVEAGDGRPLGKIVRRFSILKKSMT